VPFVRNEEAKTHQLHGVTFVEFANPSTGSKQICTWRGEVPAGSVGVPHTVNHEEVLYLLTGTLRFSIDGEVADLVAGDAAILPAGSQLNLENVSAAPAEILTSTIVGLEAVLADGTKLSPPWAN
jgi:quercetin dioxygenase-like cupin family protein